MTLARLKTKTVQTMEDPKDDGRRVVLQPRLIVHLQKTPEFSAIFDDFEKAFAEAAEEHKDDIELGESAASAKVEAWKVSLIQKINL